MKRGGRFNKILKNMDFIVLTASTVFSALLGFIYSVYAKKYVEPLEYGIFTTCTLLQTYLNYAQFGVLNSYNRDYPQLLGAKKNDEAVELKNTTITFLWIVYTIVLIAIDGFLLIRYQGDISNHYAFGYLIIPIIVIIDTTNSIFMYTARMNGKYNYSAFVGLIQAIVSVGLGLFTIKRFNYYGLFARPFITAIIGVVMYSKDGLYKLRIKINKSLLKSSILTGLPLLVNSLIWTVMQSVDKFVILIFMTTEDLGIYSVPLMGFSTMVLVPQTISQVFYYKVSELYGATHDEKLLIDKCNYFTEITSACTGLVTIIAFYILPIFVHYFMPNYTSGITPAQILIIGVAIYSSSLLYGNIFSILKMNKELMINSVVLCIFNIVFSTGFVLIRGRDISNVAYGTSLSYFLYSCLLILLLSRKFCYSFNKLVKSCWLQIGEAIVPCLMLNTLISNKMAAMIATLCITGIFYIIFLIPIFKKA